MGIPVNRKPERAVQAKVRDKNKKSVHPASRKPERAAWAKRGFPVDRKPERAIQEKVRELKRMTMPRRITLKNNLFINKLRVSDQSSHRRTKQRMDSYSEL